MYQTGIEGIQYTAVAHDEGGGEYTIQAVRF